MGRMSMAIAMARRNAIRANFPPPDMSYARRPHGGVCPVCIAEGHKCPRCTAEDEPCPECSNQGRKAACSPLCTAATSADKEHRP